MPEFVVCVRPWIHLVSIIWCLIEVHWQISGFGMALCIELVH